MEPSIVSDPEIMLGKPVVKGTRITVEHILEEMAGGLTIDELVEAYPSLTYQGIQAALTFAAESVRHERVFSISNHT